MVSIIDTEPVTARTLAETSKQRTVTGDLPSELRSMAGEWTGRNWSVDYGDQVMTARTTTFQGPFNSVLQHSK